MSRSEDRDLPTGRVRTTLDRDIVVRNAVVHLDSTGLERFSMRGLAAAMRVPVTTLYGYVGGRDELLGLVRDEVAGEVEVPEPVSRGNAGTAREIADYARSMRAMVLRHPWVAGLAGTGITMGPRTLRVAERARDLLSAHGLSGTILVHTNSLITSCAIGSAVLEAGSTPRPFPTPGTQRGPDADTEDVTVRWPELDSDLIAAQRAGFEFALERIIESVENFRR